LDGELVGVVAFNNIEKTNRCATMGYWLAKSQTGRGLMTAAVKALINEGFQQLELNRVQARVATDNLPSQAVCDRAGLKKEGVSRQAEWLYDHFLDMTNEQRSEDRMESAMNACSENSMQMGKTSHSQSKGGKYLKELSQ
jgi:RimJ/RimL family protein N-acetyltransferase